MLSRLKSFFFKTPLSSSLKGRRILVVEDEPGQRMTLERMLKNQGADVFCADNGQTGLRKAVESFPDVIILDERMPVMDGITMCKELKGHDATKNIPVIFLTAADSPQEVVEHFEIGGDMHLAKPVNAKELFSQIRIALSNQKE